MNNTKNCMQNDIQSVICKLPGIINCSIICNEDNSIGEIHILAALGRNVKQLVRDIQSAISAKFNITVDYKKISIAQINEMEFNDARVRIESIAVKSIDNMIEATVAVSYDDKLFEGKSRKVKSKSNRVKAVAEATLLAIESYLGVNGILYLEDLARYKISDKEVYVSLVGLSQDNVEESLTGSCIVSLDENESAVKAVLAAVNRKISTVT